MPLNVVKEHKPKAEEVSAGMSSVDITVQGDSVDELDSLEAKNLAYAKRTEHGMANAGISSISGPIAIDAKTKAPIPIAGMAEISKERPNDIKYQKVFRLIQGL